MQLKPTALNREQVLNLGKVLAYVAVSAVIAQLIAMIADNPDLFGPLTPVVNLVLVALKQVFTPTK